LPAEAQSARPGLLYAILFGNGMALLFLALAVILSRVAREKVA
jgi:hypothetical protein